LEEFLIAEKSKGCKTFFLLKDWQRNQNF